MDLYAYPKEERLVIVSHPLRMLLQHWQQNPILLVWYIVNGWCKQDWCTMNNGPQQQ
jgi:hypothetical protein